MKQQQIMESRCGPDQAVVLSKWIGLAGTAQLVRANGERLRERLPARLVAEAASFDRYLPVEADTAAAEASGACCFQRVLTGGILGELWEMAEEAGVGLELDFRKLPLRQETIEVCEALGENPYEISSGGALLMTARDGFLLAEALKRAGIPAVCVGRTTDKADRVLLNGERKRYLNRPIQKNVF